MGALELLNNGARRAKGPKEKEHAQTTPPIPLVRARETVNDFSSVEG